MPRSLAAGERFRTDLDRVGSVRGHRHASVKAFAATDVPRPVRAGPSGGESVSAYGRGTSLLWAGRSSETFQSRLSRVSGAQPLMRGDVEEDEDDEQEDEHFHGDSLQSAPGPLSLARSGRPG